MQSYKEYKTFYFCTPYGTTYNDITAKNVSIDVNRSGERIEYESRAQFSVLCHSHFQSYTLDAIINTKNSEQLASKSMQYSTWLDLKLESVGFEVNNREKVVIFPFGVKFIDYLIRRMLSWPQAIKTERFFSRKHRKAIHKTHTY